MKGNVGCTCSPSAWHRVRPGSAIPGEGRPTVGKRGLWSQTVVALNPGAAHTPPGLGVLIPSMGVKAVPPSLMGTGGKETGNVHRD